VRRVAAAAAVALALVACGGKATSHHAAEDDAPACFAEPSEVPEGVEIIRYDHLWQHEPSTGGVMVDCPTWSR